MPNSWIRKVYVQEFDFGGVTLKQAINMIESMDIAENIYEGGVYISYK